MTYSVNVLFYQFLPGLMSLFFIKYVVSLNFLAPFFFPDLPVPGFYLIYMDLWYKHLYNHGTKDNINLKRSAQNDIHW